MPAFNAHTVDADFFGSLCGTRNIPQICDYGYGYGHHLQPKGQGKTWLHTHSTIIVVGSMVVLAVLFYAYVIYREVSTPQTDLEAGIPLEDMAPHPKTAPASSVVVDALPVHTVSEEEVEAKGECVICCEEFEMGNEAIVLPCGHNFHPACIRPWLTEQKGECPCCREELPFVFG